MLREESLDGARAHRPMTGGLARVYYSTVRARWSSIAGSYLIGSRIGVDPEGMGCSNFSCPGLNCLYMSPARALLSAAKHLELQQLLLLCALHMRCFGFWGLQEYPDKHEI